MKKILGSVVGLLLVGCTAKYIALSRSATPKSVMIEVPTVLTQLVIDVKNGELNVHQATVTARIMGSGVFISPQGHILTCAHLFNNGPYTQINVSLSNGDVLPATLLYQDVARDLALIKVDGHYKYSKLAKQDAQVGQEVLAIGNSDGLSFTVSHGMVSHINRDLEEGFMFTQIDAPVNPGNSGGPLFNLNGELLGINARKVMNADGLGFAISLRTIREFLSLFQGL